MIFSTRFARASFLAHWRRWGKLCVVLPAVVICVSCAPRQETIGGVPVYDPNDPAVASGPEIKQSKFQVYTLYQPQIQRHDFNGVFQIGRDDIRLVHRFWSQRFLELTREGYYDDFFYEFYDYMAAVTQSFPTDTRRRELVLSRLERRFQAFAESKGVEKEFLEFQATQQRILGE